MCYISENNVYLTLSHSICYISENNTLNALSALSSIERMVIIKCPSCEKICVSFSRLRGHLQATNYEPKCGIKKECSWLCPAPSCVSKFSAIDDVRDHCNNHIRKKVVLSKKTEDRTNDLISQVSYMLDNYSGYSDNDLKDYEEEEEAEKEEKKEVDKEEKEIEDNNNNVGEDFEMEGDDAGSKTSEERNIESEEEENKEGETGSKSSDDDDNYSDNDLKDPMDDEG